MNCWHCDRPAHGVCRFCGRAVCREHAKELPHIEEMYLDRHGEHKALVVPDALYCGVCRPREDPIVLKNLD
jgi:hypothetical protein